MNKKLLCIAILSCSSSSYAEPLSYFDMSLEQLLEIELEGDNVSHIDLLAAPFTNNAFQLQAIAIPKSIEVISADTINARGLKNIVEVVDNMTGILSGESPAEPYSFSTRGFTRDSINVVYDGISMGVATFNTRPSSIFNVEQVEFIKGPAELTVGQGGAGGTINIITKKAKATKHHIRELQLSYGEFGNRSYNLGLHGPINDELSYRVDLSKVKSDGWVDHSDSFSNNYAASVLWQSTNQLELLFSVSKQEDQLPAYWGTPFVPVADATSPNNSVLDNDELVIDEELTSVNYNVLDHDITSESYWNRIDAKWRASNSIDVTATLYQFSADRHWQNAENYFYNPETQQVDRDRLLVSHDRDNWGAVTDINIEHQLFGLNSFSSFNLSHHVIDFSRVIGVDLSSPSIYIDSVGIHDSAAGSFGSVDTRRDFLVQGNSWISATNHTQLSNELSSYIQVKNEYISFDRTYFNWDASLRERASGDKDFHNFSYLVGVNYEFTDNTDTYLHYSHSHEPIFSDYRFSYDIDNLSPSDIYQLELGSKILMDEGDTVLTFALYHIEKSVVTQVDAQSDVFRSVQKSKGLDLSINTKATEQLSLAMNLALVDAQFETYYDPESGMHVDGNEPVNVPDTMANIAASYLFDTFPVEIGARVNYVSSRWADSANSMMLNSYTTTKLFAAYHGENYHVALHINNATDEVYGPWSDIYYPNQVVLAAPKLAELTLKLNF